MKSRNSAIIGLGLLLAVVAWMMTRPKDAPPTPSKAPEVESAVPAEMPATAPPPNAAVVPPAQGQEAQIPEIRTPAPKPRPGTSRAANPRAPSVPLIASDVSSAPPPRRVGDAEPDAAPDFDKIALMFRDYRTLTGENPVGTNAEIMAAIIGGNPKGAKLGPPEGQSLNENGELIDRWGTPYFFHQLTRDRMEIRSAGPDRRMWNEDDLIGD